MRGLNRARLSLLAAAVLIAGAVLPMPSPAEAGTRAEERATARARKNPKLFQPRVVPSQPAILKAYGRPETGSAGGRIVVTVSLTGASPLARHASFHLGLDPSLFRYVGPAPTGRGALLVEVVEATGEIAVYRSSLPEGFAPSETIAELEFESLAKGEASIVLTEVRLMDGRARALPARGEGGALVSQ